MGMREDELERRIMELKIQKMKFLFLSMAHGLNEETQFLPVPYHQKWVKIVIPPPPEPVDNSSDWLHEKSKPITYKEVVLEMESFFNMFLAYSPEANTVAYSIPDSSSDNRYWRDKKSPIRKRNPDGS